MAFIFDASTFVQKGYETNKGEWSESDLNDISKLKTHYPELSSWGDLALGCARGDFSQDVFEVNWCGWGLEALLPNSAQRHSYSILSDFYATH